MKLSKRFRGTKGQIQALAAGVNPNCCHPSHRLAARDTPHLCMHSFLLLLAMFSGSQQQSLKFPERRLSHTTLLAGSAGDPRVCFPLLQPSQQSKVGRSRADGNPGSLSPSGGSGNSVKNLDLTHMWKSVDLGRGGTPYLPKPLSAGEHKEHLRDASTDKKFQKEREALQSISSSDLARWRAPGGAQHSV